MIFFARYTSQRLRRVREQHGRGKQGREKVPYATFIWSLAVHALSAAGSLGHHLRAMSGIDISDAAAQERRQGLSWEWFEALFASVLQPLAKLREHPESFYGKMRLLGVDGTQWSLPNTEAHTASPRTRPRPGDGRSDAAYLKWSCAVLLELGTHQPLGAACAQMDTEHEEGELTVARRLLGRIPQQEDTLLLADRYYGRGSFLEEVRRIAGARCEFLVRVPTPHKARILEMLSDGSALVEVRVCHPDSQRTKALLPLREVRGQVWRQTAEPETSQRTEVRLWTTLCDERKHPGRELLALYAQRWEQELFFGELKRHTGREQLLRSGSPQGVYAEYGAMIIAASLLAEQRLQAAQQVNLPPVRLSLTKISRAMEALLPVLQVAGNLITSQQHKKIVAKFLAHVAREARIPPRRSRGCQRGLRKPLCAWPRIHARSNLEGPWVYELTALSFP